MQKLFRILVASLICLSGYSQGEPKSKAELFAQNYSIGSNWIAQPMIANITLPENPIVEFYPTHTINQAPIPGRQFSYAILLPANYNPAKVYAWMIFLHGMGDLGNGTDSSLYNLIYGYKYAGESQRRPPTVPKTFQDAITQYEIIGIVPSYAQFFQPDAWNWVIDDAKKKHLMVAKGLGTGFSWGAGSLEKYVRSSAANASRLALASPIAATREGNTGWENIKAGGTVMWWFVNTGDTNGPTNLKVTQDGVASFNATNPVVKGLYTAFNKNGHGGTYEALTTTPPVAPGGQGFLTAGENIYELYKSILASGPRQPKSGTGIPPVIDPPPAVGDLTINIEAPALITTAKTRIKACKPLSTGFDAFTFTVVSAPAGVNKYYPFLTSGGNCESDFTATVEGAYTIVGRACKGNVCVTDTVVITYQKTSTPIPRKIVACSTGNCSFSDGIVEKVISYELSFEKKTAQVVTTSGTYNY